MLVVPKETWKKILFAFIQVLNQHDLFVNDWKEQLIFGHLPLPEVLVWLTASNRCEGALLHDVPTNEEYGAKLLGKSFPEPSHLQTWCGGKECCMVYYYWKR